MSAAGFDYLRRNQDETYSDKKDEKKPQEDTVEPSGNSHD